MLPNIFFISVIIVSSISLLYINKMGNDNHERLKQKTSELIMKVDFLYKDLQELDKYNQELKTKYAQELSRMNVVCGDFSK